MTGNGAVSDFCGQLPDGDGIDDLPAGLSCETRMPRAAYAALGSRGDLYQMVLHRPVEFTIMHAEAC
jgi:hypothetical protein